MAGIDQTRDFVPLRMAVLTVSDTRTLDDDKSGATLTERITAAGHKVADRAIVADEVDAIRTRVKAWIADPAIDVIITTGGTGFTGRDVTPEAIEPLFEKRMDGFATLFLMVSFRRSERRPFRRVRPPVSPVQPMSFACRVRPAPARTPGTKSSCTNSTIAIARAISSRSCPGSMNICAAPRPKARRSNRMTISLGHLRRTAAQHDRALATQPREQVGLRVETTVAVAAEFVVKPFVDQKSLLGVGPASER